MSTIPDFDRYLIRRQKSNSWIGFPRDYLEVMSADAALLIQSVLDLSKDHEWTLCNVSYLLKTIKMSKITQTSTLKELKSKGLVEVKKQTHGTQKKRYISIKVLEIEKQIDIALQRLKEDDKDTHVNGKPSFAKTNARELFTLLKREKKLNKYFPEPPIEEWSKEFLELEMINPPEEIRTTIQEFKKYFNDKFMPQAYTAKGFREKYPQIRRFLDNVNGKVKENVARNGKLPEREQL